jgi:gluconolactonase
MPSEIPHDPNGRVYRIDDDGSVREAASDLAYANGIALAADAKRLYVGESLTGRIWSYAVRIDGSLGARSLFAQIPSPPGERCVPDGITLAPDGRLYVAHYGAREVLVFTQAGELAARCDAGNKAVSHVAAAGGTFFTSGGIESESGAGAIFALEI